MSSSLICVPTRHTFPDTTDRYMYYLWFKRQVLRNAIITMHLLFAVAVVVAPLILHASSDIPQHSKMLTLYVRDAEIAEDVMNLTYARLEAN